MNRSINVGDRFENRKGVWATVIKYISSKQILIRFEDSMCAEKFTSSSSLYKGSFINSDDPFNLIGKCFVNRSGDCCKVLKWKSNKEVLVKFEGFNEECYLFQHGALKRGAFRNPKKPSVFGVGFIGTGGYSSKRGEYYFVYTTWYNMIARCYDDRLHIKYPTYSDCVVCEEWHNFQNFASWYHSQKYFDSGYELDKDLLVGGNREYSPNTCTLLPRWLNNMIKSSYNKEDNLPIGVTKRGNRYISRMSDHITKKEICLGSFDTKEDAATVYVENKEKLVREKYEMLGGVISEDARDAIRNWEVYPNGVYPNGTNQQLVA